MNISIRWKFGTKKTEPSMSAKPKNNERLRANQMNIETGKTKNVRGRITGFWAKFGDVIAHGDTPAAAKLALESDLARVAMSHHTRITLFHGHAIVVSFSCMQWQYTIIDPEDLTASLTKNKEHFSSCSGYDSQQSAYRAARMHLADNLSVSSPDVAFTIADERDHSELRNRIEQRKQYETRYKVAREYGLPDNTCHLYALNAPGITLAEKPAQSVLL
jgi:hypothetical protein